MEGEHMTASLYDEMFEKLMERANRHFDGCLNITKRPRLGWCIGFGEIGTTSEWHQFFSDAAGDALGRTQFRGKA